MSLFVVAVSCVQVPTTNGTAIVFGTKADAIAIADPNTGAPVFEAVGLDQTDGLRFARDSFIADRLFSFLKAESANAASVDKAQIDGETTRAVEREVTTRATEKQITRRMMIE